MRKRALSILLALCLALTLLPGTAMAEEGGLTQLDPPADLAWGSGSTEEGNPDNFGVISWTAAATGTQNQFQVHCYRDGETEPVLSDWINYGNEHLDKYTHDFFVAGSDTLESGTYYFTVASKGDGTQYSDSLAVTSPKWEYTKPSARIATIEGLSWEWPFAQWTKPANTANIGGYEVEFYFSKTKDTEPRVIGLVRGYHNFSDLTQDRIIDSYVQANGDGYYYFKVRALSADITQYLNSQWSELSPAYASGEVTETVKDSLDSILKGTGNEADAGAIKEAVQELNTEELRTSMLVDKGNNETVELIRQLEDKAGGPAEVEATEGFDKLDTSKVSVVGANLNTTAENTATLNIGPAKNEHDVLPTQVDNTVAVSFSMDLDGVEDAENLAVPVKITLPVPASINPQFLVILHYHLSTGEPEWIHPHVYQQDGQYYASFVLTSFSDFIMTQTVQSPGPVVPSEPEPPVVEPNTPVIPPLPDTPIYFPSASTPGSSTTTKPQQPVKQETPEEPQQPEAPTVPEQPSAPAPVYRDVAPTAWYNEAASYVSTRGLMTGTSAAEFSPAANMTRAMVWTVLGRLDGADVSGSGAAWYESAQAWSQSKGVSDGSNPNGSVTREELVTMLWRYIGSPAASADLSRFGDGASVSGWASAAVQWAVSAGLLEGSGGDLNPNGTATRAEVAAILMRFCENVVK